MNAIEKLLESVNPATAQEIKKMLIFLNPETKEEEERAIAMLSDLIGLKTKELVFINKELEKMVTSAPKKEELDVAVVAKQIDELPPEQKERVRQLLARYRESLVSRERGGQHILSGMMGGPGPGEGGPGYAMITKEAESGIRTKIVEAIATSGGTGSVEIQPGMRVKFAASGSWEHYRIELATTSNGPPGFTKERGLAVAECNSLDEAVHLVTRCLGHMAVMSIKEVKGQHPLSGWQFMGASQPTSKVVTRG